MQKYADNRKTLLLNQHHQQLRNKVKNLRALSIAYHFAIVIQNPSKKLHPTKRKYDIAIGEKKSESFVLNERSLRDGGSAAMAECFFFFSLGRNFIAVVRSIQKQKLPFSFMISNGAFICA